MRGSIARVTATRGVSSLTIESHARVPVMLREIPPTLYHFTCRHFAERIAASGVLLPNPSTHVIWLTDLDQPYRDALGLWSHMLSCDRTERRFVIDEPHDIEWWIVTRRRMPEFARILESTHGAQPVHWYLSRVPQRAHLT